MSKGINLIYIVIDADSCKGCQLCLSVCPKKIIGLASSPNRSGYIVAIPIEEKASACTGCLACTDMCPDSAISVYRRSEPITTVEYPDVK